MGGVPRVPSHGPGLDGVPPRPGMGYPPRPGMGYPPGPGTGYPPRPGMGYPPSPSIASTCYAACSMPLAFTQEDFLVEVCALNCDNKWNLMYVMVNSLLMMNEEL